MSKFWNFIKNDAGDPELRISGDIVSDDDAWFYEWLGIEHTSPNAFRAALAEHKGKNLTVWIDSYGGDVFAGVGIYNALMEHEGGITVKIDGKAMSAASIIAMAGGEILMSPGGVMLIHNPWTSTQGEAKDMRHAADVLDEIKEAIMNVYELKTGKSREEISGMMDEETPMSAKTAIDRGFADGMLYTEAEESVKNYFSGGYRLAIQNSANEAMKKFFEVFREQNQPGDPPAQDRALNKMRIDVREKSHRRYMQHG